jgi:riboflavin synthase
MFTGLISEVGRVKTSRREGRSFRLSITAPQTARDLHAGDSVAVNGACLTVTLIEGDTFTVDVTPQTARSTLSLSAGCPVNLERPLRLGDRLDGHIVTGHVDFVARINRISKDEIAWLFTVHPPGEAMRHIVAKGSVAVDGISLTVGALTEDTFSVSVIPHTAAHTALGQKREGDAVNIETDILGKYVEKILHADKKAGQAGNLTENILRENGFMR